MALVDAAPVTESAAGSIHGRSEPRYDVAGMLRIAGTDA
jgi:hypothetical protein